MIKALVGGDLSQLPDAEKLRRIVMLANARVKPRGSSMVEVVDGICMSINMSNNGYVKLMVIRKNREDAVVIWERLRSAGYDAKLKIQHNKSIVHINQNEIRRHPELAVKVCEVLRRMLEEAVGESKTERAWKIAKAIAKNNCQKPAQSPRAQ